MALAVPLSRFTSRVGDVPQSRDFYVRAGESSARKFSRLGPGRGRRGAAGRTRSVVKSTAREARSRRHHRVANRAAAGRRCIDRGCRWKYTPRPATAGGGKSRCATSPGHRRCRGLRSSGGSQPSGWGLCIWIRTGRGWLATQFLVIGGQFQAIAGTATGLNWR
jgi:hypothetical protein